MPFSVVSAIVIAQKLYSTMTTMYFETLFGVAAIGDPMMRIENTGSGDCPRVVGG